jgi:hypothetical protein
MDRTVSPRYGEKIALLMIFAVAMAYLEAAVVVYLRELYYPQGFSFPLILLPDRMILIELGREVATLVMLGTIAILSGRERWERFGYFLIIFATWDIWYYLWLKITIHWPASLWEWDVLFLIPLPWIGPVIAPVLISIMMIVLGVLISRRYAQGGTFRPTGVAWLLALIASGLILYTFTRDFDATLHGQMPKPYMFSLLIAGLVLYGVAFAHSYSRSEDIPI